MWNKGRSPSDLTNNVLYIELCIWDACYWISILCSIFMPCHWQEKKTVKIPIKIMYLIYFHFSIFQRSSSDFPRKRRGSTRNRPSPANGANWKLLNGIAKAKLKINYFCTLTIGIRVHRSHYTYTAADHVYLPIIALYIISQCGRLRVLGVQNVVCSRHIIHWRRRLTAVLKKKDAFRCGICQRRASRIWARRSVRDNMRILYKSYYRISWRR